MTDNSMGVLAPYKGPLLEMVFSGDTEEELKAVAATIHEVLKGNRDYINSSIVLSINEKDVTLTCCLNELEEEMDFINRLHDVIDGVFNNNDHDEKNTEED